jgi:CheY-like chemotaxis protein/HPt (histidine-containing phosphotransfer) domain-containing protein
LRILLAEDNAVNQKLVQRLLEKEGHQVVVVGNGLEVLKQLHSGDSFDLVLMDVQMPELDGLETTARIRQSEQGTGRRLPILAMTAHAMKGDRERCLAAGMDSYLAKPIHVRDLRQSMAAILATPRTPQLADGAVAAGEEVWEPALALERVGGDVRLLREVILLFLDECPRWLSDIRAAVAGRDAVRVHQLAHSLKGSLSTFGARAAFASAQRLEALGRSGDLTAAEPVCAALADALARLESVLAGFARECPTPKSPLP